MHRNIRTTIVLLIGGEAEVMGKGCRANRMIANRLILRDERRDARLAGQKVAGIVSNCIPGVQRSPEQPICTSLALQIDGRRWRNFFNGETAALANYVDFNRLGRARQASGISGRSGERIMSSGKGPPASI